MAHIGLNRTNQQRRFTGRAKDGAEGANLNRIAQGGAGAVGFHITDRVGCHLGGGQRLAQQLFLGPLVGHGHPTAGAIMIDRAAFDHGENRITVAFGRAESFE